MSQWKPYTLSTPLPEGFEKVWLADSGNARIQKPHVRLDHPIFSNVSTCRYWMKNADGVQPELPAEMVEGVE